jgi:hypothetical protein
MTDGGEELSLGLPLLHWLRLPYAFYSSSYLIMHKVLIRNMLKANETGL